MILRLLTTAALLIPGTIASAAPVVTGNTISWPNDGWYQVQQVLGDNIVEACSGGRTCTVTSGNYIVINHSTGERFENVVVSDPDDGSTTSPITVTGNSISWPADGWYQVLDERDYSEVCAGTNDCVVTPGSYAVINHSRGTRFDGIVVVDDTVSIESPIVVNDNTISWPDDGWYQVLTQTTYSQLCGGTRSCTVAPGLYTVINHSTGMRWNDIEINEPLDSLVSVTFDVTVPAYQSNELQVKILWDDKDISANWNIAEHWTAVEAFPKNTEHLLTIMFYDMNGDIALGRIQRVFNPGENESLFYQVIAEQFDTRFDDDSDRVSNLDELIAGTDPFVNELGTLLIRSSYTGGSQAHILGDFEVKARASRPYSINIEEPEGTDPLDPSASLIKIIDFDEAGNGTLLHRQQSYDGAFVTERDGTRTNTGDSIIWMGTETYISPFYEASGESRFHVEASRVSEERLQIVADYETDYSHDSRSGQYLDLSYDFIVVEGYGPDLCLPDRGTYTLIETNPEAGVTTTTTITKNIGDEHWHVLISTNGSTDSEYLVSWLNMTVYCLYADLD